MMLTKTKFIDNGEALKLFLINNDKGNNNDYLLNNSDYQ